VSSLAAAGLVMEGFELEDFESVGFESGTQGGFGTSLEV
jgi:hypothetical protein